MPMRSVYDRAQQEGGAVQCSQNEYESALGVVPPHTYLQHGFVMGEGYDETRWFCFWCFQGTYWCMLTTLANALSVVHIDSSGKIYRAGDFHAKRPKEPTAYEYTTVMEAGLVGFRQSVESLNQLGWEVVPGSIYATSLERDSRDGARYLEQYFAASMRRSVNTREEKAQ